MSKAFFLIAILSISLWVKEGKAQQEHVDFQCWVNNDNHMGTISNFPALGTLAYIQKCNESFTEKTTPNNCENQCQPQNVSNSSGDPAEGTRVIFAQPLKNPQTLSTPTTPTEEDRTQTSAPSYQPQEEQTQNFHRPVTQGEGSEIPSDPTRNLKLAPIEREAQE